MSTAVAHAAIIVSALSAVALRAPAQEAVPITQEPHHHLVYTSTRLRVFRVEVPAHDATLMHDHPVDYFWIAVGAADIENDVAGKPPAKASVADGSVHFARGHFAHIARVDGNAPFRNVTLELTQPQTNPRNLCAAVLPEGKPACPVAMRRATAEFPGADALPEFETDQVHVTLLTIAPNTTAHVVRTPEPPVLVAVDAANGTTQMTCRTATGVQVSAMHARSGDTYPDLSGRQCSLHNSAATPMRFLAVAFAPAAR